MADGLTLGDVINQRLGRRSLLQGALASAVISSLPNLVKAADPKPGFTFPEISHGVDDTHHVASGYRADILLRWGDPLFEGMAPFDPRTLTAQEQEKRFGYNNDYIGFFAFSGEADRALLCVNHEYTTPTLMFSGLAETGDYRPEYADIEKAAHGISVVEIKRQQGIWHPVVDSPYNRRLTPLSTQFDLSGPVAGHARVQTLADPKGRSVIGTLNNCAGGTTPWRTYLSGEENIDVYFNFTGNPASPAEARSLSVFPMGKARYPWWRHDSRFNADMNFNEVNRFGWIVEVNPYEPSSTPKKRTALGRMKHEGAETVLNKDGRVVVYTGDDERFQHVYRFVTKDRFDPQNPAHNADLLDEGVLSVARFNADGSLEWLPLIFGQGPLSPANGFASQADVLIEARRAARLLGATPMDRPEDVQPHPTNGRVYVMLTNNDQRTSAQVDAVNPRANNEWGQIVELTAPGGDHTADRFTWDMLIRCGSPADPEVKALWNPATSQNGWFVSPDNCAIDPHGRLWVASDQGNKWDKTLTADGLWAVATEGTQRGTARMFFRCPVGAEMAGPQFAPDGSALFLSVQHPGADLPKPDTKASIAGAYRRTSNSFDAPVTRWPDFQDGMPPRPSVVVVTKKGGGAIG